MRLFRLFRAGWSGSHASARSSSHRRSRRRLLIVLVAASLLGAGAPYLVSTYIRREARPHLAETAEAAPARTVAIVPGARVFSDGTPSDVLRDRLDTAHALYREGKVERILVSGDHRSDAYDEVNAMHRYLVERGVPEVDIFLDHAGLRTFDTMARARQVFGVEDAIVCTQRFHLPRAVFLARRQGIDAIGVPADRRRYASHRFNEAREVLARSRAFLDVFVLETTPRHAGDPLSILGDARLTHDHRTKR